ncbi:MAG: hypothetical protein DCC56_15405 [Anaerolineae bacterium]|nr:MAG: hypothetical protein DCC56_15405 [Anaerolineae bacterium]WKZ45599.1 MAG: alpha/beta fold hydrolase [Anaerolineales bacterium]
MPNLATILRVPHVDSLFDISPDNNKIAFAWNKTGEWQIYEARLPSPTGRGARGEGEITHLTQGIGGKFNPRYSPNGRQLAYVLDTDGSESYHLLVYDFATKQHTDLTPNISHALQPNFCWSPDGRQLAILSNAHGHFSAYVIPVNGGDAELILDTGHPAWQVEWSPDGKHLAVCCEMHGQDYGIFVVEHETKESFELAFAQAGSATLRGELPQHGGQRPPLSAGINAHNPCWSPDEIKLLFHSDLHGWFDIGLYDLASKQITWLTNSEGDSQEAIFVSNKLNPDLSSQIAYAQSKGAGNWIELCHAEGRSLPRSISSSTSETLRSQQTLPQSDMKKYQVGKGIHGGIRFTSDMKRMVTTFSSPSQPSDLWMIDVESGEAIQLTHSMPESMSSEEFVMPEEIFYEGMDGVRIPALLFRPKQTPAPAVVMIHGGPNWHYSMEWNPVMAHFASRGYAVFAPNYRGSTGYGREWQYAARFDLGGVDTRDVAAGAQFLIRDGLALKNKIAVTGRSHGGYLTMTCLTQFPELWCAGSALVPFMNWFKSHDDSREDLQHWNIENMGDPKENYQRWYNASPYFFLDRINAPVQLICGGNDPRCPASDSLEARDKLVELGKEVELLLYEDEGHAFLKIENVLDAEVKRVEFIEKFLNKE